MPNPSFSVEEFNGFTAVELRDKLGFTDKDIDRILTATGRSVKYPVRCIRCKTRDENVRNGHCAVCKQLLCWWCASMHRWMDHAHG